MLMVISPAKTLDYTSENSMKEFTQPQHVRQASELITILKKIPAHKLASLMNISDKLAALNVARYSQWHSKFTLSNAKQAILAFKGDVYSGLAVEDFTAQDFNFAQAHLRILSGLYGLLRPLDLMQPYRLEMGVKLANSQGENLYAFWGMQITDWLNQVLMKQNSDILLNLASKEYFKSICLKDLAAKVIDVDFKDLKNGQYKIISFYAKKARGMMARYVIKNRIMDVQQLQAFNSEGYYYSEQHSTDYKLVFLRDEIIK